jgi:hypothetical protein
VNRYFGPSGDYLHRAKLTLDLNYLPEGSPANITAIGALQGGDAQLTLRAQLTLVL